ncbi:MAG: hypothetical protein M0R03_20120 [Novosphingobium sp.]|jgi:hypothetical protein|nr:hypothetical protein [Novosphingobium sp.]
MRAKERIEKGVRVVQLNLSEVQHRRFKAFAAAHGVFINDLLRSRIQDIIEEPKKIARQSLKSEKDPNIERFSENMFCKMGSALKELLINTRLPLDIVNKRLGKVIVPANTTINDKMFQKILLSFDCLEIDPSPIQQKIASIIDPCIEEIKREENEQIQHSLDRLDV